MVEVYVALVKKLFTPLRQMLGNDMGMYVNF